MSSACVCHIKGETCLYCKAELLKGQQKDRKAQLPILKRGNRREIQGCSKRITKSFR